MTPVLVLSNHQLRLEAWRVFLADQPGIQVAAGGTDLQGLPSMPPAKGPGALFVDSDVMTKDLVRDATRQFPGWGVLVLVPSYRHEEMLDLMRSGALGVLSVDSGLAELVSSLVAVGRGEIVLPGALAGAVLAELLGDAGLQNSDVPSLSPREMEVLQRLAQGKTNKGIAQELLLSVRTVESHLRAIYGKIGVASRTEAVLWAIRHGYATLIK